VRRDGSPVAAARVVVSSSVDVTRGLTREARTDTDGRFRITGVAGLLRVDARSPGLANDPRSCLALAGQDDALILVDEEALPGLDPGTAE